MKGINLSQTSLDILKVYFNNPGKSFYINELIRETGRYPNSIQQALKSLEKQKILLSSRKGRFKHYHLNRKYRHLLAVKKITIPEDLDQTKLVEFKPEWIKVVSRDNQIPYVYQVFEGSKKYMEKFLRVKFENFWFNGYTKGVHYYRKHIEDGSKIIAARIKKKPSYAQEIIDQCRKQGGGLVKRAKKTQRLNLSGLTKKEIYRFLKDLVDEFSQFTPFLMVPFSVERFLEKEMETFLATLKIDSREREEIKKNLLEPVEIASEQNLSQLELASRVKKYGWNARNRQSLKKITSDYCWLPMYNLTEEPFGEEHFKQIVEGILKSKKEPKKEIESLKKQTQLRKKEVDQILKKLKAPTSFQKAVMLYQSFLRLRLYRVNVFRQFNYYHLPLLYELALRMDLNEKEIKYLTYEEMLSWLRHSYGREFSHSWEGLKKEIARRMKGWSMLMWRGRVKIVIGAQNAIETIERYRIFAPSEPILKVIKGNPACRGKVTGRVKIVRKLSELNKVEEGDVLVAKMTTPDYVMAMHKAGAIVTDEGGRTCHAAIVSREFNIPCIVATRNATQILSDNDIVEVDANEGIVRVIEAVDVDENIKQIYGKKACGGKVKGPVRIVLDASDFPKVKEGDILVTSQTTPEYLSSLYKVKGFIVDEDSITSHAVLYAKALKLPAVIGTQFARNVLKDGEVVELDATQGIIERR